MLLLLATIEDEIDRSKLETIYNEYASTMYFRAFSILQNKADAEDAVQESFIKIYKNLDKISDAISSRTKSLVIIIAERTAIDFYRKRKKLAETELDENIPVFGYEGVYKGENRVIAEILKLSPKCREVLLLTSLYGYTFAQAGNLLDISEEAAKKASQRGKKKLELLCRERGII